MRRVQQSFRTYQILVLEDNPGDVVLIREAFAECGKTCELFFAENVQEAKEKLQKESFDLVISDMGTHNDEGADFIRYIRANDRLKSVPVIVLSGSPSPKLAYEAGANAFIAKSIDMDSFFSKIKALMHFWVEVVELPRAPSV